MRIYQSDAPHCFILNTETSTRNSSEQHSSISASYLEKFVHFVLRIRSFTHPGMIEVILNDRLGQKVRVKCEPDDTIGQLKLLVAALTGTRAEKLRIQRASIVYKDHITLADYEIKDGQGLELFYN
ncbi:unnamed protein product [Agarophyton chilense]